MKTSTKFAIAFMVVIVVLVITYAPFFLWWTSGILLPRFFLYFRSLTHIGLLGAYAVNLYRRLLQPQVRLFALAMIGLMIFWMLMDFFRYMIAEDPMIIRRLGYASQIRFCCCRQSLS